MRIAIVNKFWREVGGVEEHAFAVERFLTGRGHDVLPFTMLEPGRTKPTGYERYYPAEVEFRAPGVKSQLASLERSVVSRGSRRDLVRFLTEQRIDAAYVLHVYHQLGTPILSAFSAVGVPSVLSLHDYKVGCPNYRLFSERTGQVCQRCLTSRYAFLSAPVLERCWGGSRAAGVALSLEAASVKVRKSYRTVGAVTVLNSMQEELVLAAGVERDRVLRTFHPVAMNPRPRPSAPPHAVLYIGRLVPEKGVDVLLRACGLAGVRVDLIGDGRERDPLERLARDLGVDARFLGSRSHDDTMDALRSARALVVPSIWHEVWPFVSLEAIARGVPVIGTRLGGLKDQLDDGRGILVEPNDPVGLAAELEKVCAGGDYGSEHAARAADYARREWTAARWEQVTVEAFGRAGATI